MRVTFRFRGEFRKIAGRDAATVEIPSDMPPTLESAVGCLVQLVSESHPSFSGNAAFFCDGRLLRPKDQIKDGCTIHILSPLAGG